MLTLREGGGCSIHVRTLVYVSVYGGTYVEFLFVFYNVRSQDKEVTLFH